MNMNTYSFMRTDESWPSARKRSVAAACRATKKPTRSTGQTQPGLVPGLGGGPGESMMRRSQSSMVHGPSLLVRGPPARRAFASFAVFSGALTIAQSKLMHAIFELLLQPLRRGESIRQQQIAIPDLRGMRSPERSDGVPWGAGRFELRRRPACPFQRAPADRPHARTAGHFHFEQFQHQRCRPTPLARLLLSRRS